MDGLGRKILAWSQALSPRDVRAPGELEDRPALGLFA